MRSRRPGRACARPLKRGVRRPLVMPRRLVYLSLALALLAQGCAIPGSHTPDAARTDTSQELLPRLKQCLADMPGKSDLGFVSPCTHLAVASLSGSTIAQLRVSLGRPGVSSDDYVFVPNAGSPTPPPYECRWAFYTLPANVVLGGGPELQCISEDRLTCKEVRWVRTQ